MQKFLLSARMFRAMFGALLVLLSSQPTKAGGGSASLGIAPAGGQSLIYWPTSSGTNYILQTTANLTTPNWVAATNAGTINAVTVTNSAPAGYFRLLQSTSPPGMVVVPAGSFTMGNYLTINFYNPSTNDNAGFLADAAPTNVYVSAFYMDVNLVSSNLWATVYAYATNNGYTFTNPINRNYVGESIGAGNTPACNVDWYDCVKWCNARSQLAGLTPMYYTDAGLTQIFTSGDTNIAVYVNWSANGYRLPTEAEWEKAARGGLTGNRFPWGNFLTEDQANYTAAPGAGEGPFTYYFDLGPYTGYNTNFTIGGSPYPSPVGYFAPNGYGLYDMAGNLEQWCWDWYAAQPYPAGSPYLGGSNPTGPATGSWRVLRGGSYIGEASGLQCAYRDHRVMNTPSDIFGFRCVKGL